MRSDTHRRSPPVLAPNPGSGGVRGTRAGHLPRRSRLSSGLNWISAERLRRHTHRYGQTASLIHECFGASPQNSTCALSHQRWMALRRAALSQSTTTTQATHVCLRCSFLKTSSRPHPSQPLLWVFWMEGFAVLLFQCFPAVRRQVWKGILLRHMRVKQGYFVVVLAGAAGFDS